MAHKILCVTDLDGTFVKNSVDVNSVDWQAYQKLTRYSDFAIATGRSVKEINYITQRNQLHLSYAIGFNGAMIAENGNVLFSQTLASADVQALLDYLKKKNSFLMHLMARRELATLTMRTSGVCGICPSFA